MSLFDAWGKTPPNSCAAISSSSSSNRSHALGAQENASLDPTDSFDWHALPDVALVLQVQLELPETFKKADVLQVLSVMVVRPVTLVWFFNNTGLGRSDNCQLLGFLHSSGALQVLNMQFTTTTQSWDPIGLESWSSAYKEND